MPHGVVELEGCAVKRESVKKKKEKKKQDAKNFVFVLSNDSLGLRTRFKGTTEREMAEWIAALDIACRRGRFTRMDNKLKNVCLTPFFDAAVPLSQNNDEDLSHSDRAVNLSTRRRVNSILRFYGAAGSSIEGRDL